MTPESTIERESATDLEDPSKANMGHCRENTTCTHLFEHRIDALVESDISILERKEIIPSCQWETVGSNLVGLNSHEEVAHAVEHLAADKHSQGKAAPIPSLLYPPRFSQGPVSEAKLSPSRKQVHHLRTHRRHVFRERCRSFYEVSDLRAGLELCKGYVAGLSLFREVGYVHRDISPINCLVLESPDGDGLVSKISDLDCCKGYDQASVHDEVAITYQFTAVEVGLRKICFYPVMADFPSLEEYMEAMFAYDPHPHFHFLHDLESVFWVASHHIANSIPDDTRNIPTVDSVKAWQRMVKSYFGVTTESILRRRALLQHNMAELYRGLKQWWTAEFTGGFLRLFVFSIDLIAQYKALQKQPQVLLTPDALDRRWPEDLFTSDAYDTLISLLDEVLSSLPSEVPVSQTWVVLAKLEQAAAEEGRKNKESKLAGQ
ncbi:hypothetical protein DFP72DRAFT_1136358 [Ephemerocybe angulata]|uniref:Fungal-type protein kinase domain-containing protein n=1 Tax=Ephemerocybe angulata TaxID=980116 RepID=A0A8H6MGH2_9AGAR|nr:hypothetical protein DFP72DRAFT_1136358 [Tulosesus angulatus]